MKNTPRLEELISLKQAAKISGLSQSHLALLIRKNEIWGSKLGGRNWFTTIESINNYLKNERKPGPKTT